VKVSQVEDAQNQIILNIEVESQELEEHLHRVYQRAVQRVNIRGFRKGKAPRSVVERELGRDAMVEDALESLVPQITSNAIEEQKLDVIATPKVKVIHNDPVIIEATVAIRPQVELGDYYQHRIEPQKVEATPEAIEEGVETLRRESGTWEPIERPVAFEDMVTIKVIGQIDENVIMDDTGVDYIVSQNSTNPMPGFAEQLVEMDRNEERTFSISFPEDYPQNDLAGKECNFTVTVEEVKERKLPELNDEFAQSLTGELETVDALRDKLRDDILKYNQTMADQNYQEQAIQALVDGAQLDLPPLLVDNEVEHMLSEQSDAMRRQQLSMEDYMNTVGKSIEEIQEEIRPSAVERITRSLVLSALREKEGIEVTPEEVEEELNSMTEASTMERESLKQLLDTENGRASLSSMLLTRKTMEKLTSITKGEVATTSSNPTTVDSNKESTEGESEKGAQDA